MEKETIKLGWNNWNEMCDFIPKENFVQGVFVHPTEKKYRTDMGVGDPYDEFPVTEQRLGLLISRNNILKLFVEGDIIIKTGSKIMSESEYVHSQRTIKLKKLNVQI